MRLIDADALDAEMYHKSFEVDDGRNVWNSGLWIRYKIFEEAIRDAPTIDAVPAKHGKWINRWSGCRSVWLEQSCSECGLTFEDEPHEYKYCPNCGAKMVEYPESGEGENHDNEQRRIDDD